MGRPGPAVVLLLSHLEPDYLVLPSLNPEAVETHWAPQEKGVKERNIQKGENHGRAKQAPSEPRR